MIFSGKWLPVDQHFHLWPENDFAPSFSLQIISGKREKEREERAQIAPLVLRSHRADERRDRWSRSSIAPLVERSQRPRLRSLSPSPRNLIFSSTGFDSFSFAAFCFFCRIWCIFCKNVWMNQTPKLIFRKTNFVTAKHMKTFSFPENSISGKWNIFWKYFYANQTQPWFQKLLTLSFSSFLRSFYSLFFSFYRLLFFFHRLLTLFFFFYRLLFFFFLFQKLLTLSIFFTLSFSNSLFFYQLLPGVISASIFFSLFLISCCFWF